MSEDERLAKIKDLLDSTLAEFESVFRSAGDFDQSKVGNGWAPSTIPIQTYAIDPMPFDEAVKIAESRKARLFGALGWLGLRSRRIEKVEEPLLVFFPFWRIRGYHECFYFRGKTYKPTVPADVIAVQVGGRIRPLTSETRAKRSFLKRIMTMLRRTLFAQPQPKYFTIDGATELAYQYRDASVLVNGEGKEDVSMEYLLEKKPRIRRMEERKGLRGAVPAEKLAPLTFTGEDAVRLLHGKVVKPPAVFSKILTNRFEVSELDLFELPVYIFRYRYLGRERELRIHGVTGEWLK